MDVSAAPGRALIGVRDGLAVAQDVAHELRLGGLGPAAGAGADRDVRRYCGSPSGSTDSGTPASVGTVTSAVPSASADSGAGSSAESLEATTSTTSWSSS